MATNYTYPGRSLQAMGNGQQYCFYQVDQYTGQTPAAGAPTSKYPGGQGIVANGGAAGGYPSFTVLTSSGYYSYLPSNGTQPATCPSGTTVNPGVASSVTFWASDANGNASGSITQVMCSSENLTSLNISSLSSIAVCNCGNNSLTSLNVSGLTSLAMLVCANNQLGTLNITGDHSLGTLIDSGNPSLVVVGP
jgi:hypothetical protein